MKTAMVCSLAIALMLPRIVYATEDPAFPAAQAKVYDKLTHELIAPCCWREPIAIHRSEESLQMLAEVKQLVASGQSEEQIKAMYVSRYGERILADPPGEERHWLYYTPVLLFATALLLAGLRLRSLVRTSPAPQTGVSLALLERVRKESENDWA